MIEMTFQFEDELKAFEMLTYARSVGLEVASVKKDGKSKTIQEGGFLKEKPLARRLPDNAKEVREKIVTNKHVIK